MLAIMIRLTRAPNLLLGQHWVNLLGQAGITARLTGVHLHAVAGEIPVDQCGPDLWIEHEHDKEAALRIIDGWMEASDVGPPHWQCAGCGEWLEPQFSQCWRCGDARPG